MEGPLNDGEVRSPASSFACVKTATVFDDGGRDG